MDRKLIFLDIDGTLTEPGSNYPPESALKAIRGAQAKGHLAKRDCWVCALALLGLWGPQLYQELPREASGQN